jgi:tetratricopeptide (TPR) repeat protein/serine/threonine protein kinase
VPYPEQLGQLRQHEWALIQDRADRFEAAWKSADSVDLQPFLPPPGDRLRTVLLHELIKTDLEIRWRRGKPIELESYLRRIPELGPVAGLPVDLIYEEWHVRQTYGDEPALDAYRRRFPKQFPALERLIGENPAPPRSSGPSSYPSQLVAIENLADGQVLRVGAGYRLLSRIGSGSFGEVWRAEAPGGVEVAVKIVFRPSDPNEIQRELEAMSLIKRLRHQFLLQTQAFWALPDRLLIIMELADGNLRDRERICRQAGQPGIPTGELLGYFREAAEALDFLHLNSVQHRDIKPDNILLLGRHAKLGDFGLVRTSPGQRPLSVSGSGTPRYMAPEVWRGTSSPYSDQYSLAVAYAELRLRHPIFSGGDWMHIMRAHLEQPPDLSGMGEHERQVVQKALDKDATQRYPSCTEFVHELEKAAAQDRGGTVLPSGAGNSQSISFEPPPPPSPVRRPRGESRTLLLDGADSAVRPRTVTEAPDGPGNTVQESSRRASDRPYPWAATLFGVCVALLVGAVGVGWYRNPPRAGAGSTPKNPPAAEADELALLPPDAREAAVYKRAAALYQDHDYEAAARAFTEATQQFPDVGLFHQNLGHCYFKLHAHVRAVECYSRAVQLNPRLANAYFNRGRIYALLGRHPDAVADATRAIDIAPGRPAYLILRGSALRSLGRLQEADQDLTAAIERDPTSAWAHAQRGLVHSDGEEYDQALADFNRALELDPQYLVVHVWRGNVYREKKDFDRAFQEYEAALRSRELVPQVHLERGEAYRLQGKLDQALAELNEAIRLHPLLAAAFTARGLVWAQKGDLSQAVKDHSKAISLDAWNAEAHYNRHAAYLQLGRQAEADKDLETARRLNPRVHAR